MSSFKKIIESVYNPFKQFDGEALYPNLKKIFRILGLTNYDLFVKWLKMHAKANSCDVEDILDEEVWNAYMEIIDEYSESGDGNGNLPHKQAEVIAETDRIPRAIKNLYRGFTEWWAKEKPVQDVLAKGKTDSGLDLSF